MLLAERDEIQAKLTADNANKDAEIAELKSREERWVAAMEAANAKAQQGERQEEGQKKKRRKGLKGTYRKWEARVLKKLGVSKKWARRIKDNLSKSYMYTTKERAHPLHDEFNSNPQLNA